MQLKLTILVDGEKSGLEVVNASVLKTLKKAAERDDVQRVVLDSFIATSYHSETKRRAAHDADV